MTDAVDDVCVRMPSDTAGRRGFMRVHAFMRCVTDAVDVCETKEACGGVTDAIDDVCVRMRCDGSRMASEAFCILSSSNH